MAESASRAAGVFHITTLPDFSPGALFARNSLFEKLFRHCAPFLGARIDWEGKCLVRTEGGTDKELEARTA